MANSLTDLLTAAQNIAQGLNTVANTMINIAGAVNTSNISATTLVKPSGGRLATVSVIDAGSATGLIYDSNNVLLTDRPVYVIPMTVGPVYVNMPMGYGIVVAPGTGQIITVSYS